MDLRLAAAHLTPEILRGLSDEELIVLADSVTEAVGVEIVKDSDRERAIEGRMAGDLDEDYVGDLYPIADQELAALPVDDVEMSEVNAAMDGIGREMGKRDTSIAVKILLAGVTALGTIARRVERTHLRTIDPSIVISASFAQPDLAAIEELSKQQLWWIGELWNDHLSRVITATVQREALAVGLGREQVGKILRGVVEGSVAGVKVPGTWRGSTAQYHEMLAGTVRARASAFGALTSMRDADFTWYVIQAVLDERTSEQCRRMHGRRFKVSDGIAHVNRALAARDPDEFKAVAGWKQPEEIDQLTGSGDEDSQRRALAAAGMALPPYHGRCRTVITAD